ncbi:DMT family transporter [Desertibaculum subflavum]|uniref:DMT family transporter n=1 Tax=Desertibaculum subflavum TaxID=2268458 RepID=UPI000E660053
MTVTTHTKAAPVETAGIICAIAATAVLTTHDAVSKWLTERFSIGDILLYRGLLTLPLCLAILMQAGGLHLIRSRKPVLNLTRAGLGVLSSVLVVASFTFMPLAEALGVIFVSPLLTVAFAIPLLGERVAPTIWFAVAAGLAGALVIIDPGGAALDWRIAIPLCAAVSSALRDIVTRRLGGAEHPATVLFWTMLALVVTGAVWAALAGTRFPDAMEWSVLAGTAVLHTAAYYLAIQSLRLARASTVAPYKYLSLVWAALLGWAWWGDFPGPAKLIGGLLVVGAGLYVLRQEMRSR